jgi:hypothetical protein
MKTICALLFALSIITARAQGTNPTTPAGAAPLPNPDQWLLSDFVRHPEQTPLLTLEQKPNELRLGKITLSGIAVEAVKVENPLQLFNPWAPPEYGESQDNATFSLITNRVTGWKLFSFEF